MTEQQITKDKIFERLIVAQNFLYFKGKGRSVNIEKILEKEQYNFEEICAELDYITTYGLINDKNRKYIDNLLNRYEVAENNLKCINDIKLFTKDSLKKKISYKDIDTSEENVEKIYYDLTNNKQM